MSGMMLGGSQVNDGLGQCGELEDEPELRDERVAGGDGRCGQDPGCSAQPVACRGGAGQAPGGAPGGAVGGGGCPPEFLGAEGAGGGRPGGGGGPAGVGPAAGAGGGGGGG